ncbi:hypothetical protein KUL118_67080 [Tenacibaculum sp. KUL118]|nr:hypothetical protein KUL118_67080 [Tenacibaculum sp. KUL118]
MQFSLVTFIRKIVEGIYLTSSHKSPDNYNNATRYNNRSSKSLFKDYLHIKVSTEDVRVEGFYYDETISIDVYGKECRENPDDYFDEKSSFLDELFIRSPEYYKNKHDRFETRKRFRSQITISLKDRNIKLQTSVFMNEVEVRMKLYEQNVINIYYKKREMEDMYLSKDGRNILKKEFEEYFVDLKFLNQRKVDFRRLKVL